MITILIVFAAIFLLVGLIVLFVYSKKYRITFEVDATDKYVYLVKYGRIIPEQPIPQLTRLDFIGWSTRRFSPEKLFNYDIFKAEVDILLWDFDTKIKTHTTLYGIWKPRPIIIIDDRYGNWEYQIYEIDVVFLVQHRNQDIVSFPTYTDAKNYIEERKSQETPI